LVLAAEGLAVLKKFGVKEVDALSAINSSSGRSLMTQRRIPEEVLSRKFSYGFQLGLMDKDVKIGEKIIAQSVEKPLVLLGRVSELLSEAVQQLGGKVDYTEVVKLVEGNAHVKLEHHESSKH